MGRARSKRDYGGEKVRDRMRAEGSKPGGERAAIPTSSPPLARSLTRTRAEFLIKLKLLIDSL